MKELEQEECMGKVTKKGCQRAKERSVGKVTRKDDRELEREEHVGKVTKKG